MVQVLQNYGKNGISIPLNTATPNSYANSVYVDALNNVYVSGYGTANGGTSTARYWKNGVENILPTAYNNPNTVPILSYANSIFVEGNDVYVAGYDFIDNLSTGGFEPSTKEGQILEKWC